MVQDHYLQLRSCPLLFHNFWQFSVRAAAVHHPIIQEEDKLLSKGAVDHLLVMLASIPAYMWFLSILVASGPNLTLSSSIIICIYLISRCLLSDMWQLIQHSEYAFSIDLHDVYLHIPIVKHHHHFLQFVWHNMPYQWKILPFGVATAPRVFTALLKHILFLCHHKGFCIVIYLDDILVLVHS